ncbi:serine hydrolase [Chitinophaga varians]|uniref:serine hydrolase n=1 Tax=Chitinophaga varians TaxID=2202339 RepID=UPI00165FF3EF|nr:serine hydrolase [Chitinophaga varians]MBC9915267.1 serine hydrolase [Chitinophaga varians]
MQTHHYPATDNFPEALLKSRKAAVAKVFRDAAAHRLQLIYTRIDRDAQHRPQFTDFHFGTGRGWYCYPASTVKLPTAILALEKLNDLQIPGLDRQTAMFTRPLPGINPGVLHDYSAAGKLPSISHYIKKIFLVSDNDAYNRLYEFLGQEPLNRRLWSLGYTGTEIRHRVGLPLHTAANMHTNSVYFRAGRQLLYDQPDQRSNLLFGLRQDLAGQQHINHRGRLENGPMDFSYRNRLPLNELHHMMRQLFFPETVTNPLRFRLTENDYNFLYRCMSQYPEESTDPVYDTGQYHPAYVKFLLLGGQKASHIPDHIRIFNKPGWAYGFLTDTAYIVDYANHVEFLLSASLLVNTHGPLGEDREAFETTGKPFLKALGELIYEEELQRRKMYQPNLDRFRVHRGTQIL